MSEEFTPVSTTSNRGGRRPGSGRPKMPETVTLRIPASMADTVKLMAAATKLGHVVEYRICSRVEN
jgi:hypothetical protein